MDSLEEFFEILYWHVHLRRTTKIATVFATAYGPKLSETARCKASCIEAKNALERLGFEFCSERANCGEDSLT
jgi:hypothetical protein